MSRRYRNAVHHVGPLHRSWRGVLVALAELSNEEGQCWAKVPTLAGQAHVSATSVRTALAGLEAGGLIRIDRGQAPGERLGDLYQLFPEGLPGPT